MNKKYWGRKVIDEKVKERNKSWKWIYFFLCRCKCWTIKKVRKCHIVSWRSVCCWCDRSGVSNASKRNKRTHWLSRSREYGIYCWARNRCNNKKLINYRRYWWRWIKILWNSFEDFHKDMWESYADHVKKHWEKNTTLDRIDNNWHYCKENCRRATYKQQWDNRDDNIKITYLGKKYESLTNFCLEWWLDYRNTSYKRRELWLTIDEIMKHKN